MTHPLATNDQRELEALALRIAAAPPVRAAREQARSLLLNNVTANTRDGAAGLDRALDQWVMGGVVAVANSDPSRPRALWAIDNTPREWFGHVFPGAAVAIDNPDNVNRTTPLDGAWEYEITGRFGKNPTAQTSFIVTPAAEGQLRLGDAIAALTNQKIQSDSEGRFTITLDGHPAGGRINHMRIADGPQMLAIRDSHSNWRQQATEIRIAAVNGPAPREPMSEEAVANHTLPIHAVMPGKCFRLDTPDARHNSAFSQIETHRVLPTPKRASAPANSGAAPIDRGRTSYTEHQRSPSDLHLIPDRTRRNRQMPVFSTR